MEIRTVKDNEQERIKNFIVWILEKEFPVIHNSDNYFRDLDDLKKVYGEPRCTILLAEEENQVVGTVAVKNEDDDAALIRRLFIHPAYRRRGFGLALLGRAMDFCRMNGYKKAFFCADSDMFSAVCVCLKYGFRETERVNLSGKEMVKLQYDFNEKRSDGQRGDKRK